jgi:hypothetical protein
VNVQFFPIWDPKWSQMIHWNVNIHDMTWYDTEINYRYLYMYIIYIYTFSDKAILVSWRAGNLPGFLSGGVHCNFGIFDYWIIQLIYKLINYIYTYPLVN